MVNRPTYLWQFARSRLAPLAASALFASLLCAATSLLAPATAADAAGNFKVFGSGELACGRWLEDRRDGTESGKQSEMWIAGYLSAVNEFVYKGPDITEPYDGTFVLEWLDSYCHQHPSHALAVATHELLVMLRRRQ